MPIPNEFSSPKSLNSFLKIDIDEEILRAQVSFNSRDSFIDGGVIRDLSLRSDRPVVCL